MFRALLLCTVLHLSPSLLRVHVGGKKSHVKYCSSAVALGLRVPREQSSGAALPGPALALPGRAEPGPAASGHWLFCRAFLKSAEL